MRRLLAASALAVLALAAFTVVPTQTGCGSSTESRCARAGESCMTKTCCPHADGSYAYTRTFEYPNGVQTVTSCTCE